MRYFTTLRVVYINLLDERKPVYCTHAKYLHKTVIGKLHYLYTLYTARMSKSI